MNPEDEFLLSFYTPVSTLNSTHNIILVKNISTGVFYIKKTLTTYNLEIYQILMKENFTNIPKLFAVIEDALENNNKQLILIEEFINGQTIAKFLENRQTFSTNETIHLILRLCQILMPLHQQHPPIIHRDIKPSNLMINEKRELTLIDFNTARFFQPTQTTDTIFMGTKAYAPPEQYGYSQTDIRSDIYAIGITMIELLTGLPDRQQEISGVLGDIIHQCIAINPDDRFQDLDSLCTALQALLLPHKQEKKKEYEPKKISQNNWKRTTSSFSWLPPGFRTKTLWKSLLAIFGYISIFYCGLTLEITNKDHPVTLIDIWSNRISFLAFFLGMILFNCNYRCILDIFPLYRKIKELKKKVPLIIYYLINSVFFIVCDFIILVIILFITIIIEGILNGIL